MSRFSKDEEVYFYNKETNEILPGKIFDIKDKNQYQIICYIDIKSRVTPYTPIVSESEISHNKDELECLTKNTQMYKRYKLLLRNISKTDKGLEIGPYYHPIAPKEDGWQTTTVDILSKEDLIKSLSPEVLSHGLSKNIEDVDILWDWKNESLEEAVKNKVGGNLDYIISSHSIEHIVDILDFVKSCSNLLKVGGVFNLAVPDLRYTFDFFRSPSSIGQVLSVHNNKPKRHSSEVYLDAINHQSWADKHGVWPPHSSHVEVVLHPQKLEVSWKLYKDNLLSENHTDCHNWVFTPSSFKLLFFELWILGFIDVIVNKMYQDDSEGSEFIVQLTKTDRTSIEMKSEEIHEYRSKLLSNIVIELAQRVEIGKFNYHFL
jgi:SAM-dependent methyltransferase